MRICGLASCLIFFMIQLIQCKEYARPSPTDMPYSQRDILNKKENMKTYLKTLKSFKIAQPEIFNNETEGIGKLLVEDEKIRIPYSPRGLGEVTKIYLDQNKLSRYLRILDLEIERTPPSIQLDSSKIIDYVKILNNMNKHDGKSADLVSRSRIKLMKGGITDNVVNDEKKHEHEAGFYDDDYQINKRDTEGIENINDKSLYLSADENRQFFDSHISGKKSTESFKEDSDSLKSGDPELNFSRFGDDIAVHQYIEGENYDLDSDLGNQLLRVSIKQPDNEKNILPENTPANKFNGDEFYNIDSEPSDEELIDNLQIQPSSATEYFGFASAKRMENDPQEPAGNNDVVDLSSKNGVQGNNEKPSLNDWSYENKKKKDQLLFDSPFHVPVPINHVNSKYSGDHDDKNTNINDKRQVELQDAELEQWKKQGGISYENGQNLELNETAHGNNSGGRLVNEINRENIGSLLTNLQNKLYSMEKPANKLNQVTDSSDNISTENNTSLYQQFLQNMYNDKELRKAIAIKTAAFFRNASLQNITGTEPPINSGSLTDGPSDHKIFPLKPDDEIINVPKMKYFEQCLNGENNNLQFSLGMPTKPPKMFSKYYISRLKKFQKYDDDSGSLNFLKQPRMPLFGTKESEVSKILNVNLDHLHIDKGALFKIIGKALKIDEENAQDYAPPKWLEHKYEELLHASHRGQNFNDYDYIERSRHNLNQDHLLNIRDRKESVSPKKNAGL